MVGEFRMLAFTRHLWLCWWRSAGNFRVANHPDLGALNSVSAAASACHQHTSYVLLSIHSVIEKLSGAS
jgi:hypothetical protein